MGAPHSATHRYIEWHNPKHIYQNSLDTKMHKHPTECPIGDRVDRQ